MIVGKVSQMLHISHNVGFYAMIQTHQVLTCSESRMSRTEREHIRLKPSTERRKTNSLEERNINHVFVDVSSSLVDSCLSTQRQHSIQYFLRFRHNVCLVNGPELLHLHRSLLPGSDGLLTLNGYVHVLYSHLLMHVLLLSQH